MSFLAGEVYSVLGAKVREGDFAKYDARMEKSGAKAEAFEKRHAKAMVNMASATERSQVAQQRSTERGQQAQAAAVEAQAARQRAAIMSTAGVYEDANGRLREANGRFLSSARQVELGLDRVGTAAGRSRRDLDDLGTAVDRNRVQVTRAGTAGSEFQGILAKGLAGGALAAAVAIVSSAKKYADFEQTLNVLQETAGATDREMVRVRRTAKDLGNDLTLPSTSARDAADAMTELAKGGLSITESMGAARGVLQLSAAAQISNGEAATIVADNLSAFNLRAEESVRISDLLAASANATTASIPEMGLALQQSAASAHQLGIPIEDLVTMIGELANAGIKGSDAGTSVKTMLSSLTPNSDKAAEAIKKLGVETFDADGKFRGVRAVIDDYRDGLSKLTDEQKAATIETIFGSDASRAAAIILDGGTKAYDKLRGAVTKQGAAADLAKAQTKGLNGSWEALKSQVETIQIGIGEKLAPALTDGTHALADLLGQMQSGEGAGGDFIDRLVRLADVVEADVGPSLSAAREEYDKLKAEFEGAGQDFSAVGDALGDAFGFVSGGAAGAAVDTIHAIGDGARATGDIVRAVGQILRGDWGGAWESAKSAVTNAMAGVGHAVSAITAPIRQVGESIDDPFRSAADAILGLFSSVLTGAASVVDTMSGIPVIGDKFKGFADGIRDAAAGIDALRAGLREVKLPSAVTLLVRADAKAASSALAKINGTKVEGKVVKILGADSDARTKINQLRALGIPPKTARVLAAVGDALAGLSTVQQMMARLNGYVAVATVRIQQQGTASIPHLTQRPRKATGRGAGRAEEVLVGENQRHPREAIVDAATGRAMIVDGPTIMALPDTAYVIPEDPAYRGRAMGFLAQLAGDLGLRGFKKGKAPAKSKTKEKVKRDLPGDVAPTKLPLAEIEDKRNKAKSELDKAKSKAEKLPKNIDTTQAQIRDIKRRKPKTDAQKRNKVDDLRRAERKLADQRDDLRKARAEEARQRKIFKAYEKERVQAVKYQEQITKQEQIADTAAAQMRTADSRDDQGAYDKAKAKRLEALKALRGLLDRARKALADQDSEAARELDKTIASTDSDVADTEGQRSDTQSDAERAVDEEAQRFAESGMTAAERARKAQIEKGIALAALTAPLDDDAAAAGDLVSFFDQILGAAPGRGLADDVITEIAQQARQARDNLTSLTTGGARNSDPDLQAQLDQANERTRIANESARINAQALAVFGGSGDIGAGGPNAMAAARGVTINQNITTLHPGTPQLHVAIADAALAGVGYKGGRPSKVEQVAG